MRTRDRTRIHDPRPNDTRRSMAVRTCGRSRQHGLLRDRRWPITSDSPEVRKLVESGLAALEKPGNAIEDPFAERLGGQVHRRPGVCQSRQAGSSSRRTRPWRRFALR